MEDLVIAKQDNVCPAKATLKVGDDLWLVRFKAATTRSFQLGFKCEKCKPGYFGNPITANCKPCLCDHLGSLSKECDNVTGQCLCKEKFTGLTCDKCEVHKLTITFYIYNWIYAIILGRLRQRDCLLYTLRM